MVHGIVKMHSFRLYLAQIGMVATATTMTTAAAAIFQYLLWSNEKPNWNLCEYLLADAFSFDLFWSNQERNE